MATRYLFPTCYSSTYLGKLCNNLALANSVSDSSHNREFSGAPQVVLDNYPELVATQKAFYTSGGRTELEVTRPRRRLGDMNPLLFWLLIFVAAAIIIAASVGGAVGGALAVQKSQKATATVPRYLLSVLAPRLRVGS